VLAASASDIETADHPDFRSPMSPPPRHDSESEEDRAPSPPSTTTAALAATTPAASAVITLAASAATTPASPEASTPVEVADPSGPARPADPTLLKDSSFGTHPDRQFRPIVDQEPTGATRTATEADEIVAALESELAAAKAKASHLKARMTAIESTEINKNSIDSSAPNSTKQRDNLQTGGGL
jgi:hypothetical protein